MEDIDMNKIWDFTVFHKKEAFLDDTGVSIHYDELNALQQEFTNCLEDGKLCMLLCENSLGSLASYAACLNSGHAMILLSAAGSSAMRKQILNTYRPGYLFAPKSLQEEYLNMEVLKEIDHYVLLRTNFTVTYPLHPELALMLSTSGSTGSVKFVRRSWETLRTEVRAFANVLETTEEDRTITSMPMNYSYGLSVINASLLMGGTMIVTKKGIMDEEFWDLFENENVTAFHGVPNSYDMLSRMDMFCEDFPHLRLMTESGGKLRHELQKQFAGYAAKFQKKFMILYGQCETSCVSCLPNEKGLEKIGSIGIATSGGTLELVDSDDHEIHEPHLQGEIVYHGNTAALGYAVNGEDLAKGDELNGIVHTGDIAERDEEGYLFITGRSKRFIKMAGHRVSLDDIDEHILEDLHIKTVSSGRDDDLVIFVLREQDIVPVQNYVRERLPIARTMLSVRKIDEIPRNDTGKILYAALLELAVSKDSLFGEAL